MTRSPGRQILTVVALIATVAMNWLAVALPLNGKDTGQLSDQYPTLITPAGYAFAIWSVIYLGLAAFAVYQALPAQRTNQRIAAITPLFWLSCVLNVLWLVTWHYEVLWLNVLIMLGLLASLIAIYIRLRPGRARASLVEHWVVDVPFSIYLGWITVATIVNITVVLYAAGWSGSGIGADVWAAVLLGVGALIAAYIGLRNNDAAYPAVIVWAFLAVAQKHANVQLVQTAALLAAGVAAVVLLAALVQRVRGKQPLLA